MEAPDGTSAVNICPLLSVNSTSTVGFPRLSNISRACKLAMLVALRVDDLTVALLVRRQRRAATAAVEDLKIVESMAIDIFVLCSFTKVSSFF